MTMSDKTYNLLKWVAMILLPAAGTLYFALASIWGLPYGEEIVGTITAIDAFLGALLGITANRYDPTDGTFVVAAGEDDVAMGIQLEIPADELLEKDQIVLKVKRDDIEE